jgi:hypothetical protein
VASGLGAGLAAATVTRPTATGAGVVIVPTRAVDVRVRYRVAGSAVWTLTSTAHSGGRAVTVPLRGLARGTDYEFDVVVGCDVDPLSAGKFTTAR